MEFKFELYPECYIGNSTRGLSQIKHVRHVQKHRKVKVKVTQSCPTLCNPMDCPSNSPCQNTGVGSLSLLQGIILTQELNCGLLHCRRILYQLSY